MVRAPSSPASMRMWGRRRCHSVTAASENRLTSMRRLSSRPEATACHGSANDEVDELAGDDVLLDDLLAVQVALHGISADRQAHELLLGGVHSGLDPGAEPAVDLH